MFVAWILGIHCVSEGRAISGEVLHTVPWRIVCQEVGSVLALHCDAGKTDYVTCDGGDLRGWGGRMSSRYGRRTTELNLVRTYYEGTYRSMT